MTYQSKRRIGNIIGRSDAVRLNILGGASWDCSALFLNKMRADIVPGAVFTDYELSDHTGKHRKLSELQEHDPMILVLARGGFCPKDRRQHEGLVQLHREMEVGYC